MNKYTLLVWEVVPEDTFMYLIPNDIATKYSHFLNNAHNKFINANDMAPGLNFLCYALSDERCNDLEYQKYQGIFMQYKHDIKNPIVNKTITHVYLSGFML